jgi:hypothetical protein
MAGTSAAEELYNLALVYAMSGGNKGSGGTPNTYAVPLTHEQKRIEDEKWRVYKDGGSPSQQALGAAGRSLLSQVPSGPSNFSFLSPEMKGQQFAGGIKLPTFNFAAMPATGAGAPVTGAVPGKDMIHQTGPTDSPIGGGAGGMRNQLMHPQTPIDPGGADPKWNEDIGDYMGRNPGATSRDISTYFDNNTPNIMQTPAPMPGAEHDAATTSSVASAWQRFRSEHPNWASLGVNAVLGALTAATGLPGAIVSAILKRVMLSEQPQGGGTTPAPPAAPTGGG